MSEAFILAAVAATSGLGATTYGYGESFCGDETNVRICNGTARTASGLPLGVHLPVVALALPVSYKLRGTYWVPLSLDGGATCRVVLLADKKHERFAKTKPWDFSPQALRLFGVKPSKTWSTREVTVCKE